MIREGIAVHEGEVGQWHWGGGDPDCYHGEEPSPCPRCGAELEFWPYDSDEADIA
jgi:hypothetical protein